MQHHFLKTIAPLLQTPHCCAAAPPASRAGVVEVLLSLPRQPRSPQRRVQRSRVLCPHTPLRLQLRRHPPLLPQQRIHSPERLLGASLLRDLEQLAPGRRPRARSREVRGGGGGKPGPRVDELQPRAVAPRAEGGEVRRLRGSSWRGSHCASCGGRGWLLVEDGGRRLLCVRSGCCRLCGLADSSAALIHVLQGRSRWRHGQRCSAALRRRLRARGGVGSAGAAAERGDAEPSPAAAAAGAGEGGGLLLGAGGVAGRQGGGGGLARGAERRRRGGAAPCSGAHLLLRRRPGGSGAPQPSELCANLQGGSGRRRGVSECISNHMAFAGKARERIARTGRAPSSNIPCRKKSGSAPRPRRRGCSPGTRTGATPSSRLPARRGWGLFEERGLNEHWGAMMRFDLCCENRSPLPQKMIASIQVQLRRFRALGVSFPRLPPESRFCARATRGRRSMCLLGFTSISAQTKRPVRDILCPRSRTDPASST